jgi:glycosyltransferase involved in cell wall biosynthesis
MIDKLRADLFVSYPGVSSKSDTFGGSPYFLMDGMRAAGLKPTPVDSISPNDRTARRLIWNALEVLKGRGYGGYQYSDSFLRGVATAMPMNERGVIINMFQLYEKVFFDRTSLIKTFYIDQTLSQLFNGYGETSHISSLHRREAISEERRQYHLCDRIFCKQSWVAHDLITNYGIPAAKVKVIVSGANVEINRYYQWVSTKSAKSEQLRAVSRGPLKLIFVGKDWKRKGLDRLIDAIQQLPDHASRFKLSVIGIESTDLPKHYTKVSWIHILGRISKEKDLEKFFEILSAGDVGVLLSRAEAGGSSLREFQLLGLGVIGPEVGGSPDMICEGAGLLVAPGATVAEISRLLDRLERDRTEVEIMKAVARKYQASLLWSETAAQFARELEEICPGLLRSESLM